MPLPGWYHDPSGTPGRFRYWDGDQWRPEVTDDPHAPPPVVQPGPGAAIPADRGGSGSRAAWMIATGATAVVLLVALVLLVVRPFSSPDPSPTGQPPPVPTTAGTASPGGGPDCFGGNGRSADAQSDSYLSTGVRIAVPEDWTFRLDKSQWMWLHDQAAWGKLMDRESGEVEAGVLGGLAVGAGFADPEQASADVLECLSRAGVYSGQEYPQREVSSEPVTLDGMTGWRRIVDFEEDGGSTRVTVHVLDTGVPDRLASLTTLARTGSSSEAVVEEVVDSIERV